jgi:PAS domain S-box-containing protein
MTKRLSLRARLKRIIIITGISFYLLTSFIVATIEIKKKKSEYASAMITIVKTCKAIITGYISQYHEYIQDVIAKMPDGSESVVVDYFHENLHFQNLKDIYYILDHQNRIVHISEPYKQYLGLDLSHIENISKKTPVSKVHQSLFSQQPVVSFLYPLARNRLLVLEKNLKGIIPLAEHFNLGEIFKGSSLFILSSNGTVVYHPDSRLVDTRHNLGFELFDWSELDSRGLQTFIFNNKKYLCYQATLEKPIGWTFFFVVPNATLVRAIFYHIAQMFFIYAAVFSFLIFILQFIINKKLSKPVDEIVASIFTRQLDGTDEPIPQSKASGTKELTRIIDAINNMMAKLNRSNIVLKEREERYRTLIETLTDVIFILDLDGRFTYLNPEFEKITGHPVQDFIGHPFTEILTPEYTKSTVDRFKRGLAGETIPVYEVNIRHKYGKDIPVELKVSSLLDDNGKTSGRIGLARDITDRKRAEEELKQSEEQLKTVLESIQTGIMIIDPETRTIIDANPAAIKMIGLPKDEIINQTCDKYISLSEEKICPITDLGQKIDNSEHILFRSNGQEIPIMKTVTPILLGGKNHLLESFIDISEKKRLEAQLQQAQKMEAIGTLAGGIAHDFNNIMQIISGYTQILLLDKEEDNPDYNKLLGIEKSVERGTDLIERLLVFGRKVESNLRPVDLNHEVAQASRLLERTIPKMINIELHLSEDLKTINADPVQIEQIIMNLGVNARDAMPDGGKLAFETENVFLDEEYCKTHLEFLPGEHVLLSISDTGHGVDEGILEHIFEPFCTTKETGKGTGLGLAMVYGIVKGHSGNITCHSKPREGATFRIYFPVLESEDEEVLMDVKEEEEIIGGSETILLVDDEDTILDIGRNMLGRSGYTVITARNGEEAIEVYKAEKNNINLIILDINMPGMGGHKCLKDLLEIDPKAKIIIATGYPATGKVKETLESSAAEFIGKPFRLTEMLEKLRRVLDS